jgi:hypothetical protein
MDYLCLIVPIYLFVSATQIMQRRVKLDTMWKIAMVV